MAWMPAAVRVGLIGKVTGVHCSLHWHHLWGKGTPFEAVSDLVLFDFGVHWFNFVMSITGRLASKVVAQAVHVPNAGVRPAMLSSALMDFGAAQASLISDAATPFGASDTTYIAGAKGSLVSPGPDWGQQVAELYTESGVARPEPAEKWFNDGFAGAIGELLCAIEQNREPETAQAATSSLSLTALQHLRRRGPECHSVPATCNSAGRNLALCRRPLNRSQIQF